jgi:hypothetical protein
MGMGKSKGHIGRKLILNPFKSSSWSRSLLYHTHILAFTPIQLNIDLVNSSDSTTSQARPIDADPDFRPYPVATGPQPPTLQDPASGVMQQAYSLATRYAFQ